MDEQTEPLPVAVITGFLGSGKTTLLNYLLRQPELGETAVIVNEFGEIGIDHHLIESSDEGTVLLNSGCLCCTVRGDLVRTLRDLFLRRVRGEVPEFRQVLIETTGLADPAPVLQTLMTDALLASRYALDSVISTIDAVNGAATLDAHVESVKQAAVADRLVLTKTDLAGADTVQKLERRLRALNPAAPILRAEQGVIDPRAVLAAGLYDPARKSADVQAWLKVESYGEDHGHAHDHDHHHHKLDVNRHDAEIAAFCLTFEQPFDWPILASWLDLLARHRGEDLLRVKGVINVVGADRPVAIHGVQHLFHPPAELPAWPSADRRSRIVFITRGLARDVIEQTLRELAGETAS